MFYNQLLKVIPMKICEETQLLNRCNIFASIYNELRYKYLRENIFFHKSENHL